MDYDKFKDDYQQYEIDQKYYGFQAEPSLDWVSFADCRAALTEDRVNSPSHYTSGSQEAIDIIEDAIKTAPSPEKGMLQAQVLKYLLRLWLKDNPTEDAKKAQWYLKRLISKLES